MNEMKKCSKCEEIKDLGFFNKNVNKCKTCQSIEYSQWYGKNKEKVVKQKKEYRKSNKEKIKKYKKQYCKKHKEKISEKRKQYCEKNREKIAERERRYCKKNKEKIAKQKNRYEQNKRKHDVNYKLSCNLRTRLVGAIKNNQKAGSAVKDLGCAVAELKKHLEAKFQEGMSWDNWTTDGWHIDHIIPLSKFDLTNRKEFLEACHFTNLQPLWAVDNFKKSNNFQEKVYE